MNLFGISGVFCVVSSSILAIFLFLNAKGRQLILLWGAYALSISVWGLATIFIAITPEGQIKSAYFWWKIAYVGLIFLPALYYYFVCEFVGVERRKLHKIFYILSGMFFMANLLFQNMFLGRIEYRFNQFYWTVSPGPLLLGYVFIFVFGVIALSNFELIHGYFKVTDPARKRSLLYFAIGSIIGWCGGWACYLENFDLNLYPAGNFCINLYPILMAYSIYRYKLLDIEVIIKKTLVFAGLLASVFTMLILPTLIIQEYIFRSASFGAKMVGLAISGVIIILTMRRIEGFLINITDKYLFQKKYDYKALLKTFTNEVLTVLELGELVHITVTKLSDIIKLNSAAVCLFNKEDQQFEIVAHQNIKDPGVKLTSSDGIVTFMEETHGYLLIKDLHAKKIFVPASIQEIIDKLSAQLIIPMVVHDEVVGILSLGKKKSDEDYSQDDLDILLPLAKTLAIAISNAKLFVELGQTQAEAAQKEKMATIGTLSAGINHEICNPLGIARGQCEAFLLNLKDGLYKAKTDEELLAKAKDIMAKVIHETDRATAITKKLSHFAKPAKGDAELVHIDKEIDDVLGLVGYELKLEKIEIAKHISTTLPDIFVDRKQFQEILFNLIRNAGQAIGEKGKVDIIAREEHGKVFIDIKDTGHGIPEDKIKQLFNPFFTTKDPGKGTGLGLFIVRQVVEKNGGRIHLKETKVGEGTTFTLEFPTADAVKEKEKTKK